MSNSPFVDYFSSPVGIIRIEADEAGITVVSFNDNDERKTVKSSALLNYTKQQLQEYFEGTRKTFELPLHGQGTAFQQKVWNELLHIDFGITATYLQMAKRLGDVKVIRAAASANGKNPIAIIIPCHRVIGADGKLTGYAGGLHRKQWLLEHEAKHAGHPLLF
ncbi:MAG: methylated-DNA--[protein]-cysteine S-methyltransferase [Chitinophagaceae bacterium]|nr:methylated-DNA--[protein]-cysteine S-methyltransferase [Chitinophagaceae bacterium]